jgi:hypothetical protein
VFLGDALILFRRLGVDVPSSSLRKPTTASRYRAASRFFDVCEAFGYAAHPQGGRPSWTSITITAAVIVLVLEAARKCVSPRGGVVPPSSVAP